MALALVVGDPGVAKASHIERAYSIGYSNQEFFTTMKVVYFQS